jgi:nitrate reductase delta subunit
MTLTLKALGALLTYPTPDLLAAAPEIGSVLDAESRLSRKDKAALHELLAQLAAADVLDAQERYVSLFDRGRATSLNLFEHVHGDSRERGPAMVDLMQVYARAGYALAANELPDYLPVLLEFLSQRPFAEAKDMLSDCAHILRRLGEALRSRDSRYDAVPAALLAIIGEPGLAAKAPEKNAGAEQAGSEKALDEEWLDAPVIFGPEGAPGCATAKPALSVIKFVPRPA